MKLLAKDNSKNLEAISVAFNRSLNYLEIEPARFKTLPLRQRRLALCEAIFSTAHQVDRGLNWYLDRSELQSKKLWDFSPEQIRKHQTILDSLIALVCLGETSFVRPLVTYLSFPEARWSITIDSVLRAISEEPMKGHLFRLPSESDKGMWRDWVVGQLASSELKDFGTSMSSQIGIDDIRWHDSSSYGPANSSLINGIEFLDLNWKYFDDNQARFCGDLYELFSARKYNEVAESIDIFVNNHPSEGNYNTIVTCLNDWIDKSELSRPAIKQRWIVLTSKRRVSPKTVAVLFQVLDYSKKDRRLAREFGKKMLGRDEVNLHLLQSIIDLLIQNRSASSIVRVAKTYSDIDQFHDQTRNILLDLAPMFSTSIIVWLSGLFSTEVENICILGAEYPPKRKPLLDSIVKTMQANNRVVLKLKVFEHSANPECQRLGRYMREFYEFRTPFEDQLENQGKTSLLVSNYLEHFRSIFRTFLCLVSPETKMKGSDKGDKIK